MHAMILGHKGAFVSGREVTMPISESAATKPPILVREKLAGSSKDE